MSNPALSVLGEISTSEFLETYWQKKPVLIRQAFPGFESPLDADELAGLACEEGVESRLILQNDDKYALEHGPFDATRFATLPKEKWTLLVQDIEKHLPQFAAYLDYFDFLPHWRIDDLMISHAAAGGSVGPHTDAYDVFLLQAKGRRRWSIAESFQPGIVPGMDVKVLSDFEAEQEWILEPGDMLYLPPNVAHEGIALDDNCMTWSIGFRAPSLRDMFLDFSEWLHQRLPEDTRYSDPDLAADETGKGMISPAGFARMRMLMRTALGADDAVLDTWFGQFMTEPKPWLECEPSENPLSLDAFRARLESGDMLVRDTRALLAWRDGNNGGMLFVNGEALEIDAYLFGLLEQLCKQRAFTAATLEDDFNGTGLALLRQLHEKGVLHFASTVEVDNERIP